MTTNDNLSVTIQGRLSTIGAFQNVARLSIEIRDASSTYRIIEIEVPLREASKWGAFIGKPIFLAVAPWSGSGEK